MPRHSYISSIEHLQTWFMHLGKPKWNLYRGHQERMKHGTLIARQDDDTAPVEESFDLLRNMIEMNSGTGGQFTVYVPQTASGNQGSSVHVGINMTQHQTNGRTSLAGYNNGYALGMIPAEKVQEEIQRERRVWELERRLEDMEAAQDAGLGIGDIVKEQLRGLDLTPIIAGLVSHFAGGAGVQLQGTPTDEQPAPEGGYAYDGQQLRPILDIIRPHFEHDEAFYGFLLAVANGFAANPEFFKTQFGYA